MSSVVICDLPNQHQDCMTKTHRKYEQFLISCKALAKSKHFPYLFAKISGLPNIKLTKLYSKINWSFMKKILSAMVEVIKDSL